MSSSKSRATNYRSSARFALVVILSFVALSCASVQPRHEGPFIIHGMVYDDNGQPADGVTLSLGDDHSARSDFNGRFYFVDIMAGQYELRAEGKNLELLERKIHFNHPSEVIYLSMISTDGLYRSFRTEIEAKNWNKADRLIDRAIAIAPDAPLLRYAKAVALSAPTRPGRDWATAESIVRSLISDGYAEPAIVLLLADICQYDKNDMVEALEHLRYCLKMGYDPKIEERVNALTKEPTEIENP